MNDTTGFSLKGIVLLATVLILTACGGGGSGGGGTAPLPTGTFTKAVELPGPGGVDWSALFSSFNPSGARYQGLVLAQDLNGSGPVNALSFRFGTDSTGNTCPDVTIKMGHTSVADLSTTYADNTAQGRGSVVTVFSAATLDIPNGSTGDYFTLPLNGAFSYNGVDNLVVDIVTGSCTGESVLMAKEAGSPYAAQIWAGDSTAIIGSTGNALAHMKLDFAGGDDTVQYPGSSNNVIPFWTITNYNHIQMLHLASDVNGSGPITGIALMSAESPTNAASYTVNIKLDHTTLSTLTDTFANNFDSGSPVTVASALTFNVPAGVPYGAPIWLPVTGAFNYNGTDNLIVDIEITTAPIENTAILRDSTIAGRNMRAIVGDPTGTVDGGAYDTVFRFDGGTMDVITSAPDGSGDGFPFWFNDGVRQYLFLAAELGTSGQITQLGCRNRDSDAVSQSGLNYTVTMGHTAASVLGSDRATNLPAPVVVYSGILDQPGLLGGDWFDIPLSTPFTYNGTDNLVVEFSGTGGADSQGVACRYDTASSTRYASRRTVGSTSGATALSTSNALIDMRFTLQ